MPGKKIGGTRCPRCKQYANLLQGDILGEHKTEFFLPFSKRKERCIYSGGTRQDAINSITPLRRRAIEREKEV